MYLGKYFDQLPHFYAVLEAHDTPDSLTAFLRETGADNIALDGLRLRPPGRTRFSDIHMANCVYQAV